MMGDPALKKPHPRAYHELVVMFNHMCFVLIWNFDSVGVLINQCYCYDFDDRAHRE